jgi:ankyrin repeat protein
MERSSLLLLLLSGVGCATLPKPDQDLFAAAVRDDTREVERLLATGANVNARDKAGWTPLHKAMERFASAPSGSRAPDAEMVAVAGTAEVLLSRGADVNVRSGNGIAPIHSAAATGEKTLVQLLIGRGADVRATSSDGVTPLFLAAGRGAGDVADLLIAHGADVNARTRSGYTPLSNAADHGSLEVVRLLVDHGAEVNAHDREGATALGNACVKLLLRYTLEASTPAALERRRRIPAAVLARARQVRAYEKGEFSAVAIVLLEHGADANTGDGDFQPLQTAALVGDRALAEVAIAHGAAVNGSARPGAESPLHAAIAERHADVARLLLEKGADVNARNTSGFTPLHFLAVHLHDRPLAELLIQHGAEVGARDQAGHTPLEAAIAAGNDEVAESLRQHGAR